MAAIGLEPRDPRRQLEQQRQELPVSEPQQQQPVEHEQQHRLPPLQLIAPPDRGRLRMSAPRTGDDPAVILFQAWPGQIAQGRAGLVAAPAIAGEVECPARPILLLGNVVQLHHIVGAESFRPYLGAFGLLQSTRLRP